MAKNLSRGPVPARRLHRTLSCGLVVVGACAHAMTARVTHERADARLGVATVDDAGPAVDSGGGDASLVRLSTSHGCRGASDASRTAVPESRCVVRGTHAFVFGIVVPLGDGTFVEVGLYGGGAAVEAPTLEDARSRVTVTEPLHIEGSVVFDRFHVALTHAQGGQVHPTLKLAPGSPLSGVASGDRFLARALFGYDFSVGPLDLACSAVGLGDDNEFETIHPKPDRSLLVPPRRGAFHAEWAEPLLVKASPAATEGLRIGSYIGGGSYADATFAVLDRRQDHLKIQARTVGGSELTGWVESSELPPAQGGHGEGIGLCGCGHPGRPQESPVMTLATGAEIHARPDGPVWATVPAPLEVTLAPGSGEWRQVVSVDRVSEGGDACSSERLEHAWVRGAEGVLRATAGRGGRSP